MYPHQTAAGILKTHGNSILRLAYSYLHNLTDAEDVLQDTLLRFLQKQPVLESPEHEKAWLFRVTINICKNRLREKWFKRTELPETLAAPSPAEEESEVTEAVLALPVKYREVIHLFYYEEYSTGAIAALLHKNESTVRSLLRRGRGLLKEQLKGDFDFDGQV